MKYLSGDYALNFYDIDWHTGELDREEKWTFDTADSILKDFMINYEPEIEKYVAKPSRAILDMLLINHQKHLHQQDLFKQDFHNYYFALDDGGEKLENIYDILKLCAYIYLHEAKKTKVLTFHNTQNSLAEFKKQLGPSFKNYYPDVLSQFNFHKLLK